MKKNFSIFILVLAAVFMPLGLVGCSPNKKFEGVYMLTTGNAWGTGDIEGRCFTQFRTSLHEMGRNDEYIENKFNLDFSKFFVEIKGDTLLIRGSFELNIKSYNGASYACFNLIQDTAKTYNNIKIKNREENTVWYRFWTDGQVTFSVCKSGTFVIDYNDGQGLIANFWYHKI